MSLIKPGQVLSGSWSDGKYRVLASDQHQVLYEWWLDHKNAWSFHKLTGSAIYGRFGSRVVGKTQVIGEELLSDLEKDMHRPDLPLCFCRSLAVSWEDMPSLELAGFEKELLNSFPAFYRRLNDFTLPVSRAMLVPFGPKGAHLRGTMIESKEKQGFKGLELVWKAAQLQPKHPASPAKGIGIYRSGFQKGVPSFYLWGATDLANHYPGPEE